MAFTVQPDVGFGFSFGPWPNCRMFFTDSGVDQRCIIGIAPEGSVEYDAIGEGGLPAAIWAGDLPSAVATAGSYGNFITSLYAPANARLKAFLNLHPAYLPVTNASPVSLETANEALAEYVQKTTSADGNYPILSFKPYP